MYKEKENRPPGDEEWIYGVMEVFFVTAAPGAGQFHYSGQHQALFAQVLGLLRWLRQRFVEDDLSMRLGHPDSSRHSSARTCKRRWMIVQPNNTVFVIRIDCLTFQVLILLAHSPHADLFVDHIDSREAASATGWNMSSSLTVIQ